MTYPDPMGHGPDDGAGAVDDKAGGLDSIPPSGHADLSPDNVMAIPLVDYDGDDGLPDVARYEGPSVPLQEPLINPSAGDQGPPGVSLNPQGSPDPHPGSVPVQTTDQAPQNSSKGNPSYKSAG